jgi:hypothetical protein
MTAFEIRGLLNLLCALMQLTALCGGFTAVAWAGFIVGEKKGWGLRVLSRELSLGSGILALMFMMFFLLNSCYLR